MQNWNRFPRALLVLCLLIVLCAGLFAPRVDVVEAAPKSAVLPGDVVISEFRTRGPSGAGDEFVELYNPKNLPVDISGLLIRGSSNAGVVGTRYIVPALTTLQPGQYYLIVGSSYNGSVAGEPLAVLSSGTADDGGFAITLADGTTIIDQVGMSAGSAYKEPDALGILTPMTTADGAANKSYERNFGGSLDSCQDTNNNLNDFELIAISNPQNLSTLPRLCGGNADLSLTQTVDNATPIVGNTVTFTIIVSNAGTGDARNVEVKDTLPPGLTFSSTTSATQGSYSNTTGIWTVGTIANGTSATLSLVATVTSGGVKTNWAEVWSSYDQDPTSIPGNNSTTEDDDALTTVTVPGSTSVLNITNVVNNPTPNVGANVVFTITVSNPAINPFVATNINVAAPLPIAAGVTYVSSSATVGTYNSGTGNWSVGNLAIGSSATLSVTAKVTSNGSKNYSASVSSVEYSPSTATATVTPIASTQADLSLTQTWNRSASVLGGAELKIIVNNDDLTNIATGVQVKALLPSGLTYVSHITNPSGTNYNNSTGIWAVGTVNGGGNSTLTITVKPSASGTSTTSFAEIWLSDQFDTDSTPGNGNTGEDDSNLFNVVDVQVSDLSLTQTVDIAGSNAVFTIVVTNAGPDDASNVMVSNTTLHKPDSYIYVSDNVGSLSYDRVTGVWTIGALASGTSKTLIVTTTITTITSISENVAEVSAVTEVDPDSLPDNGSRTEDDDASAPSADLSLAQIITSPSPYNNSEIGTNVNFRITVTNAGYATATNVEVKDLLPSGLAWLSSSPPSGTTYNKTSGIWAIPTIARNTSLSLDITARVDSFGIKVNLAEVWKSDQSDPDSFPGNSSITEDDYASVAATSYRSVIINEIAWSGTAASAEDEWIELFNPSTAEITITGWKIRKNSCGASGSDYINLSGKIASNGYFLLERGDTASDDTTVLDITASQIYLVSIPKLLDSGETLYLCDNLGKFIDNANQEGASSASNPWPKGGISPNYPTMERTSNATESDASWATNNGVTKNGKNANGGLIYGTPGKKNSIGSTAAATAIPVTNTPTPAPIYIPPDPRPIINEFLPRPGFDWNKDGRVDVFDEFVEIKNLTSIDINLGGWKLDDEANLGSNPYTFPDITLKPGQRVVYFALETNVLLSDGGDTVRLISPGGKIYDAYTYTIARVEDQSICRLPDGNVYNGWFEDCIPTPNLTNSREGSVPTAPEQDGQSLVCKFPDTLPADFLLAECRGYGANIWNADFWDQPDRTEPRYFLLKNSKWENIIE